MVELVLEMELVVLETEIEMGQETEIERRRKYQDQGCTSPGIPDVNPVS